MKEKVLNLERDNDISKKLISAIQNDLQSQNEEVATQKKNISILNRGLRSGIFEELPGDKQANAVKNLSSTMLPDFTNGRSGFQDASGKMMAAPVAVDLKKDTILEPKDLLANAEIKIRKSEYREGLMKLDELRKKFPNYDDNGRSFLLAAEAWLKLKEYNNVIPEIRNFYLKYQTSADLAYAKLLEGQANEGNGSFEKAATLYNEVISLSPQSTLAQTARDGMLRMRDQK
ncbi:MAG: outer membrane protein assembly factor BamD [Bdellovibrionota bacterium]